MYLLSFIFNLYIAFFSGNSGNSHGWRGMRNFSGRFFYTKNV
ncbi:hypothetical protein BMETH_2694_0 [methanotrophic bacterial endosymbiont of Bathymodiolus sp.]|nr:hypothetical protein BMETH_2694_0 [methanotrophic bacterial endosymbiont of Bathymodiolus sp.]